MVTFHRIIEFHWSLCYVYIPESTLLNRNPMMSNQKSQIFNDPKNDDFKR